MGPSPPRQGQRLGHQSPTYRRRLDAGARHAGAGGEDVSPDVASAPRGREMNDEAHVLDRVRRALGRAGAPVPPPPAIPDAIARLVPTNADLAKVFIERAAEQKMTVTATSRAALPSAIADFVGRHPIRRVAISSSPLLDSIAEALRASVEVQRWNDMTLDRSYDVDCGITEVTYA